MLTHGSIANTVLIFWEFFRFWPGLKPEKRAKNLKVLLKNDIFSDYNPGQNL